jgi:hypothetical protein
VKSLTRSPVVAPSSQLSRLFVELKVLLSGNSRLCALACGVFVRVVALGSSRPGKGLKSPAIVVLQQPACPGFLTARLGAGCFPCGLTRACFCSIAVGSFVALFASYGNSLRTLWLALECCTLRAWDTSFALSASKGGEKAAPEL